MPVPTTSASHALSKDSYVGFSNHSAIYGRVASDTATDITFDNLDLLSGKTLYATGSRGQAVIITGVAGADNGKVADVTAVSGAVATVATDLSSAVQDGSIVGIMPPMAIRLQTNGGHTLQVSAPNDKTKGLGTTFLTHNTPNIIDVAGDIPFYLPQSSQSVSRLLAWAFGAYKLSGTGQHDMVPIEDDDGTYTLLERATIYSREGDGTSIEQVFGNLFATSLSLNVVPEQPITGSISCIGNFHAREVGGSGKNFSSSANGYVKPALSLGTGSRYTGVSCWAEFGGSFGSALTDARETKVTGVTIDFNRGQDAPRAIGNPYVIDPEESTVDLTVTINRVQDDNDMFDRFSGDSADLQDTKNETRLLLSMVPVTPGSTESITFDIPKCFVDSYTTQRQEGRFMETVVAVAQHTLTSGAIDTANPLIRARILNGVNSSVATTLT